MGTSLSIEIVLVLEMDYLENTLLLYKKGHLLAT
jgi:hypothetical protein